MSDRSDRAILASLFCPAGRLCGCRHGGRGPYDCPKCGCTCSYPDQFETDDDPDACPCCHVTSFHL